MSQNRFSYFFKAFPAVSNIIIINLILWLASTILPQKINFDLVGVLGMHFWRSELFNPVQIFTYMFLHDTHSIEHVFFNMFGVYMFGRILEQVWGTKKFLFYYFVTGIGAAIIQQLCWEVSMHGLLEAFNVAIAADSGEALLPFQAMFKGDLAFATAENLIPLQEKIINAPITVGASGALFGLLLAFGWLFPDIRLFIMFIPIPIKARWFVVIYGVAELFLGIANFTGDNVAHFAHLGGMIFGAILILWWKKRGKLYNINNEHYY